MVLRLTHVLALMALVLAAGVLSVQSLEGRVGGTVVQGTVVVAAPGLTLEGVQALARERAEARWTVLPAGPAPLSPFDDELVSAAGARGTVLALFGPPGLDAPPADSRAAWRVLVRPEHGDAVGSLLEFLRSQVGTRPFLAGLLLPGDVGATELVALLDPLLAAAESLPSYRRTSFVLLGERQAGSDRRVVLRLDRGRATLPAPATLSDLQERPR